MEEVIEVKPGGLNKYYLNSDIIKQYKDTFDKITVDSNSFRHSFNDEPAVIVNNNYDENQILLYFNHGRKHRLTGPATIFKDLNIISYYIEGVKLSKEEWETEVNRIQMLNEIE